MTTNFVEILALFMILSIVLSECAPVPYYLRTVLNNFDGNDDARISKAHSSKKNLHSKMHSVAKEFEIFDDSLFELESLEDEELLDLMDTKQDRYSQANFDIFDYKSADISEPSKVIINVKGDESSESWKSKWKNELDKFKEQSKRTTEPTKKVVQPLEDAYFMIPKAFELWKDKSNPLDKPLEDAHFMIPKAFELWKNKKLKPIPLIKETITGKIIGTKIRGWVLNPWLNVGRLGTLFFDPLFLALDIFPFVLSPRLSISPINVWVQPRLLAIRLRPELLTPDIFANFITIDARAFLLSENIQPCALGPRLRLALLRMQFIPRLLHQNISPSVLCPTVDVSLLGIRGNPQLLTSNLSPGALSPAFVSDLFQIDLTEIVGTSNDVELEKIA